MKRVLITITLLVLALLTISGKQPNSANAANGLGWLNDVAEPQKGDEQREEFHQSYPLSANGRVSLENINGNVRIAVWDQAQVKVDAIKRAYNRERLNEARIEVDTISDGVRIRTRYPDRDQTWDDGSRRYNNPASVEYSLTVPRQARLESIDLINGKLDVEGVEGDVHASSINGSVTVTGLMGEAKLSTINGPLQATFAKLADGKVLSLNSVNGTVTVVLPSDANAQLRANTVHGSISNDFGLPVNDGQYVGHELSGQLGAGGPHIKLGNVNGGIRIKHAGDGRPLSQATNLLSAKDDQKIKVKIKDLDRQIQDDVDVVVEVDGAKIAADVQREVNEAMRESQREIARAQREIQRDIQRQVNDQVREKINTKMDRMREGKSRFSDRESKSFTVSGTPSVNVGTFDGSIVVHAWDKNEVTYTAVKRGDNEEALRKINIEASQQGSAISIIAKSPQENENENASTSLEVYVPRNTQLHVSSEDGRLRVEGVSGELIARTGDGSIEIEGGKGKVQVNTGDGRIRIANFDGEVDARTGDGSINLEGNFSGVSARTGDGAIILGVPSGSNFVVETNSENFNNEGLSVTEDLAPSARVKRWRIGRGGAVFTLNTGDGRVVVRSR